MTEIKLYRATFLHIESELYAYHDTKKEIVRLRNEILYSTQARDENVGGGRSSLPSDRTGQTAVLLMSSRKIDSLERIVEAIEWIVERLPDEKKRLIRLRYWDHSRKLTWDGIAAELHVSRRQAIRWRDGIVNLIAEKIGWR